MRGGLRTRQAGVHTHPGAERPQPPALRAGPEARWAPPGPLPLTRTLALPAGTVPQRGRCAPNWLTSSSWDPGQDQWGPEAGWVPLQPRAPLGGRTRPRAGLRGHTAPPGAHPLPPAPLTRVRELSEGCAAPGWAWGRGLGDEGDAHPRLSAGLACVLRAWETAPS